MQKQYIWEDGDVAIVQSNVCDTHYFEEGQEVILIDAQTTNVNKPAAICKAVDSLSEWCVLHENLSPKSCEINHRTDSGDNSIDNLTLVETPTSDDKVSLVQRIALAHKAAHKACTEATEAYKEYAELVGMLKEEVGAGFKIEQVKWEDMCNGVTDMTDWRNWQEGDIVECVGGNDEFDIGDTLTVTSVEDREYYGTMPIQLNEFWPYVEDSFTDSFKWISRPS